MAKVIKKGEPYRYYDFECPKCHSIVRFGESELHEYEDCYDTLMVETDERCPNCFGTFIQVPKMNLEKYLAENNMILGTTTPTVEKPRFLWKWVFKSK